MASVTTILTNPWHQQPQYWPIHGISNHNAKQSMASVTTILTNPWHQQPQCWTIHGISNHNTDQSMASATTMLTNPWHQQPQCWTIHGISNHNAKQSMASATKMLNNPWHQHPQCWPINDISTHNADQFMTSAPTMLTNPWHQQPQCWTIYGIRNSVAYRYRKSISIIKLFVSTYIKFLASNFSDLYHCILQFDGWAIIEELWICRQVGTFLISWGQKMRVKHCNVDLSSWFEFWFARICIDMNAILVLSTAIQQFREGFVCNKWINTDLM